MAYLPGVPDGGPAPVSPTAPGGAKTSLGKPGGISAVAHSVGKPGNTEHLGSIIGRPGKGMTSVGGGDPLAHSLNHYGKPPANPAAASKLLGGQQMDGGTVPTAHAGAKIIRGESGQMRQHVRTGGLGAGKMGMPGPSDQDTNSTQDTE